MEVDTGADTLNEGRLVKMDIDYAPQVDDVIPAAQALTKVRAHAGNLHAHTYTEWTSGTSA
jgi:hypothetical protein